MLKKIGLPIFALLSCCLLVFSPLTVQAQEKTTYTSDVGLTFSEPMPPKSDGGAAVKPNPAPEENTPSSENVKKDLPKQIKHTKKSKLSISSLPTTGDATSFFWVMIGFFMVGTVCLLGIKEHKRKVLLLFGFAFCTSLFIFSYDTQAASTKSKADVFFLPPDEINKVITPPKHPCEPSKEADFADENQSTGIKGPLSLDFVPTIQFNAQRGSWSEETYHASLIKMNRPAQKGSEEVANYVQVTDSRIGASGWTLTLKQNHQFRNENKHELDGTEIKLQNLKLVSAKTSQNEPTAYQNSALDPSGKTNSVLIRAEQGTGTGTWLGLFGDSNEIAATAISVTVPENIVKEQGKYTTSLTWELQDSPI
ncbi:WxL domain-containing protein [Listeria kieliensis]